jgi:hypothetical protein
VLANIGNLPVGGSAIVTIVVRPTNTAIGTTLTNFVKVTAVETDPNLSNNVSQVVSTTVIPPTTTPVDTIGPTVVGLERFGFHARPTRLLLTFNEALDPARATDLADYRLTGPRGKVIRIRSATYNAGARTVTLRPTRLLNLHHAFKVVVNGTTGSVLADVAGNALDGDGDGRPGGDFTGRITRASLAQGPAAPQRCRGNPSGATRTRV